MSSKSSPGPSKMHPGLRTTGGRNSVPGACKWPPPFLETNSWLFQKPLLLASPGCGLLWSLFILFLFKNFVPEVRRAELMLFLSSWCVHIWRKGNYLRVPLHSLSLPREHHFCFIYCLFCFLFIKKFCLFFETTILMHLYFSFYLNMFWQKVYSFS